MPDFKEYIELILAVHGLAVVIVNMTPTPKDNEALQGTAKAAVKIYRAIEILAGVVTPLAKR